jgi:hypothetical protein
LRRAKEISSSRESFVQHPGTELYTLEEKVRKTQILDSLALFYNTAYSAFPKTFVLNRPDFDFQNICVIKKLNTTKVIKI